MKTISLLLFAILISASFSGIGQGIIIDHTCTDVSLIPDNVLDSIVQHKKLHWCGQSHSHQVPTGLGLLEEDFPALEVTINTDGSAWLPGPNGTFCIMDGLSLLNQCGACCQEYIYPSAYWEGSNASSNVNNTLINCYPSINVSGFLFCGELQNASEAYVQDYLNAMTNYELLYPNVKFIYTTGHAQANDSPGHNRWLRNNQIRQYCIDNNKILFDFADLDCWYNGEFNYYTYNGDTVPLEHTQYEGDLFHTTEESCIQKAKAIWYMMALLSDWQPNTNNIAPQIEDQSFNIDENISNGELAGIVNATDPNTGQILTFSILEGNINDAFQLDASTGELTVQNSNELNFEVSPTFSLLVEVVDNGTENLSAQATITIDLNDINEPPIIEPQNFTVSLSANYIYSDFQFDLNNVAIIEALDPDVAQLVTYTCIDGNGKGIWGLNQSTGELYIADPLWLVMTENHTYPLHIEVMDDSPDQLTSIAVVNLEVNIPCLADGGQNILLSSNADEEILTNGKDYTMYPNPSNNFIYIELVNNKTESTCLTLQNMKGQTILKKELNNTSQSQKKKIDISHIERGMYIVQIEIGDTIHFDKLIRK